MAKYLKFLKDHKEEMVLVQLWIEYFNFLQPFLAKKI